ncbi:MAG: hypothetical protein EBR82_45055, partial [Caulobacteraceae bacterium]|nr:hypothetical protein [Caulobacteraceae bacterium]
MSTPAQRAAAARKRALMTPRRATIDPSVFGGKGEDKGKTAAPGASGVQMPPEGRTHFFIRGRGPTIDFGPILRPRSTGVSPTEGNAYEPTTGVGGFFRRLLGDNADELNASWANQRLMRQMGQEDMAAAQAFEMQKIAAQQANALALADAQRQGQMGIERYRAQSDLDRQFTADTQALIRQAAELRARGQMSGAENVSRENVARINAEGDVTRSLLGGSGGSDKRYLNLGDGSFLDVETGTAFQPNRMSEKGGYLPFNLHGAGGDSAAASVGITDAQRQAALQAAQATKEENTRVQAAEGAPLGFWGSVAAPFNALAEVEP